MYKDIAGWHFNYCYSVWDSCGTTKHNKLQKLPNRAARTATHSALYSSAAPLIQEFGRSSIGKLIHPETSSMAYKCLNKLAPEYLSGCFSQLSDYHTRNLRNFANCEIRGNADLYFTTKQMGFLSAHHFDVGRCSLECSESFNGGGVS